jgi:hypothetical protein
MSTDQSSDVVRWVQEGERLFGLVLQTLQRCEALTRENQQLRRELEAVHDELGYLRAERVEAAETLKTFADHVTQVTTIAIERLGARPAGR